MRRLAASLSCSLALLATLALGVAPATADDHEKADKGKKAEKATMVHEGLQFRPLAEGNPIHHAVIWGDPATGPSAMVLRLPAGHANPMHTHSASYTAILLEGSAKQWNHGQTVDDVEFAGPGAHFTQEAGNHHAELLGDGGPTYVLIYFDGPFDFIPMEAAEGGE